MNAATAEFLVAPDGSWYFLELNARLQVEHPATELAFGIDLVAWQLRIARGEHLTLAQSDIRPIAHAIEARVYAEDPVAMLPTGGRLLDVHLPSSGEIRIDHALSAGSEISLAYDPMLAKVLVAAPSREAARTGLIAALEAMALPGVVTNIPLLLHALRIPSFVDMLHHTGTLEATPVPAEALELPEDVARTARSLQMAAPADDPFASLAGWRASSDQGALPQVPADEVRIAHAGDVMWVTWRGQSWELPRSPIAAHHHADEALHADRATLTAPMPGTVITTVPAGTHVTAGEAVVVLEAMKMENSIAAPFDGIVEQVSCSVGDLVTRGAVLAEVSR